MIYRPLVFVFLKSFWMNLLKKKNPNEARKKVNFRCVNVIESVFVEEKMQNYFLCCEEAWLIFQVL